MPALAILQNILIYAIPILFAITVHEVFARLGGKYAGRSHRAGVGATDPKPD